MLEIDTLNVNYCGRERWQPVAVVDTRLGLALGSIIIGSLTDYAFGDPQAVGKSLAVVLLGAGTLAIISLGIGCRLFRDTLIERAAAPSRAPTCAVPIAAARVDSG